MGPYQHRFYSLRGMLAGTTGGYYKQENKIAEDKRSVSRIGTSIFQSSEARENWKKARLPWAVREENMVWNDVWNVNKSQLMKNHLLAKDIICIHWRILTGFYF